MAARARWWWWRNKGEQTTINCDVVDGSLKLRSPLKIMFDIDTCSPDNKLIFCIIL